MDWQEASDRLEIADLLTRYTRAVDTKTYDDLAQVFTPDAVLDYRATGGPIGTPDEVVPWIAKGLAGFRRTQHILGQLAITFEPVEGEPVEGERVEGERVESESAVDGRPSRARVTAYFTNPMVVVNPDGTEGLWEVGGYYHHDLVRLPDGWRSTKIVDDVQWTRGF